MKKFGVPLVEKPADMIGKVDGMLIEVGGRHCPLRAREAVPRSRHPVLHRQAVHLLRRRREEDSRARREEEGPGLLVVVAAVRAGGGRVRRAIRSAGKLVGCAVHGPASLSPIPERNAGLFHYGIHPVEVLYTLMGPGCKRVTSTHEKGVDVVTGHWKDGRVATLRGIRDGASGYGFTAFAEKGIKTVTVGTAFIYRELLKKIVEFFKTGKSPVDPAVTIEIVALHRGGEQERREPRSRRDPGECEAPGQLLPGLTGSHQFFGIKESANQQLHALTLHLGLRGQLIPARNRHGHGILAGRAAVAERVLQ